MSRIPLGRAHVLASSIIHELRHSGVETDLLTPVGSLRRFAPEVGGTALFAAAGAASRERLLHAFATLPSAQHVPALGDAGATIETGYGPVTLHVAQPIAAGAALVWLTGSVGHVHALAGLAAERRLRFAAGRLTDASDRQVRCETEQDFYALLDLPFIPPELRHGDDEVAAAREGRLPDLVADVHIRGDLHMHSTWSDGRDPIETMVWRSAELGYEYIAITDHSQRAWSSRSLAVEDLAPQRAEIARLQQRHANIRILHGVEVDIMKDGSLDFANEVLAGFDIVLASLHDHGGQPGPELTGRYLAAMHSPYVDAITHPLNRTPGVWEGYTLDLDRLFAAAAETGTAMEVDGAPGHLDMDGAVARRAVAAGVTILVNSDCHRAEFLRRQMRFGVGTARRGWVEPRHVLNTRSVEEVLAFVARKRARG
ncbi:MAG: DNA polymerase/3'-5' exonuclease PolX [Vicinamibacterales bacterium]